MVYQGNYEGDSGGMEGTAMEIGIARLKKAGMLSLVKGWVCDKDSSVSEQLRTGADTTHIPIHYDPGHIKKNFQKSLMSIYGAGARYTGLAKRGGNRHQTQLASRSAEHSARDSCSDLPVICE